MFFGVAELYELTIGLDPVFCSTYKRRTERGKKQLKADLLRCFKEGKRLKWSEFWREGLAVVASLVE